MTSNDEYVLQLLREAGYVTAEQLENASTAMREGNETTLDVLVASGVVTEDDVLGTIADQFGIKYVSIDPAAIDAEVAKEISPEIAHKYGVSTEELIFAESPHMKSYYVTRKGQGMSIERTKAYKYQSLVGGFVGHKADVFIVTVEPKPGARTIYKNSHPGQEFNLILEGKMELYIGGKTIILEEGDSIYFDSTKPHGMLAVGDKAVKFLAFTVE